MFHTSFILFTLLAAILALVANPCPCDLIVNESLVNNPAASNTDLTHNQLVDIDSLDDYLERLAEQSHSDASSDASALYPLLRQTKSLDISATRLKRPSWAAVGKRAAALHNKRPSWAQVG